MINDPSESRPVSEDHNPLISIIIPVHNREKMASEAVQSVFHRPYPLPDADEIICKIRMRFIAR
jgi:cellulose synthase/poly-beta-1,6-N-acetylglucosamine synthase-like glycosyltransferase